MLKNRLLSIGIAIYAVMTAILVYADGYVLPLCFFALTVSCCLFCTIRFFTVRTAIIFASVPIVAFAWYTAYTAFFLPAEPPKGDVLITATVENKTRYFSSDGYLLSVRYSDSGIPVGSEVLLYSSELKDENDSDYSIGDLITVSGKLSSAKERPSFLASGIEYYSNGESHYTGRTNSPLLNIRKTLSELCFKHLPDNIYPFVQAITVGDRSAVTTAMYLDYSNAGVSHILAVSGLHLSVLVMAIYALLTKIKANRYLTFFICTAAAFSIALLSGFSLSTVRSAIMLSLFFAGTLIRRNADSFTSLFAALLIILLANPYAIASLSLQLSFLSTLGIITAAASNLGSAKSKNPVHGFFRNSVMSSIMFSFSAFLFTLPVIAFSFDRISLISVVTNIFVGLTFPFVLVLSYVFIIVALILPFLVTPLAFLLKEAAGCFIYVCQWFSDIPSASVSMYSPTVPILSTVCAASSACLMFVPRKRHKIAYTAVIAITTLCVAFTLRTNAYILNRRCVLTFLTNRGNNAVCAVSGNDSLLVDYGGAYLADDILYRSGSVTCDTLVLTSLNEMSVKKTEYYMECLSVKSIFVKIPSGKDEADMFSRIFLLANENGCDIMTYNGLTVPVGDSLVVIDGDSVVVHAYGKTVSVNTDSVRSYTTVIDENGTRETEAWR